MSLPGRVRWPLFGEKNFPRPPWAVHAVCRLFQGRSWTRSCLLPEHHLLSRPFSGRWTPSINVQMHNRQKISPTDLLSRDRSLMFPIFPPHLHTILWLIIFFGGDGGFSQGSNGWKRHFNSHALFSPSRGSWWQAGTSTPSCSVPLLMAPL